MEKIVRIMGQEPLKQRSWTSQSGENLIIKSKEFLFSDGIDQFVGEATDKLADDLDFKPIPTGSICAVQFRLTVREWNNAQQERVRATNIRIIRIMPL